MNNEERIKHLPMRKFQELFGVKKLTFSVMLMILRGAYFRKHAKGGRPPKISALDCLVITLQYYREYRAMEHIAFDYGVWKSTICEVIRWTEQTLIKSGVFRLPSKRALFQDASLRVVLIDVTECETERPKKKQRQCYSGKKKKHTMKVLIVMDADSRDIICIAISKGKTHDFKMYKESGAHISDIIEAVADKGFQGLQALHPNSVIPVKASKNHKLTAEEKKANAKISKRRIYIEHVNRYIKRFRILSGRYRNKQKKFGLRVSLICGIYNFQHAD